MFPVKSFQFFFFFNLLILAALGLCLGMRASLVVDRGLQLQGSVFAAGTGLLALQHGILGFPGGPEGKESTCNVGDPHSIPEWGRSPGEGNGNPLQYSCLGNPTDGGGFDGRQSMGSQSPTRLSD